MPAVTTYRLSGNPYIDGLLGEVKWAVSSFAFSFPTSGSFYESPYGFGEPSDNFGALNATQQSAVRAGLAMSGSVADLRFTERTETSTQHADLRFAMSDKPSTAWAYLPTTAPEGGDAWFNNSSGRYDNPVKGNYAYLTFLHEIGHTLGLHHPHSGNVMPVDRDSLEYTVMSYRSYVGASASTGYTNETWGYPQSLMMYDIAALQHLYGPNYGFNSGDTTYSWSPTTGEMFIDGIGQGAPGANRIFLTIWDGGGVDIYDFSNYSTNLTVDLRPGQWTTTSSAQLAKLHFDSSKIATGNIANALLFKGDPRSLIENAKGGTGDDVIIGNTAGNKLVGISGDDSISGLGGNDTLIGNFGDDTLVDHGGDDRLLGGVGQDHLFGAGGVDRLFGARGNDQLSGGAGDDRLFGGNEHDLLVGNAGDDRLLGGNGDDQLYGGTDDDVLIGNAGADLLIGGDGSDSFVFRFPSESPPRGMDTIQDFVAGVDLIHLAAIDANTNVVGNHAFTYIGTRPFTRTAGELNFLDEIVAGDVDGDGAADLQIIVAGVSSLTETDFFL